MNSTGTVQTPPVPYNQNIPATLGTEEGFKKIRGNLTVGRYFVFERHGYALSNTGDAQIAVTTATPTHDIATQRWVLEQYTAFEPIFKFYSAVDERYVDNVTILFLGPGEGYSLNWNKLYCQLDGSPRGRQTLLI